MIGAVPSDLSERGLRRFLNDLRNYTRPLARVVAHRNGTDLSLTVNGTNTIVWTTADSDTAGWLDLSTGKYTPKEAGDYLVLLQCEFNTAAAFSASGFAIATIRFNGTEKRSSYREGNGVATGFDIPVANAIVTCNGSTDYIDTAVTNTGTPTTPKLHGTANRSWLSIYQLSR